MCIDEHKPRKKPMFIKFCKWVSWMAVGTLIAWLAGSLLVYMSNGNNNGWWHL